MNRDGAPTGWRRYVKIHPACEALPLLERDQLQLLAADIVRNGLREPIRGAGAGMDGMVHSPKHAVLIDGRNRLDAWESLGKPIIDEATGEWHQDFLRRRAVMAKRTGRRKTEPPPSARPPRVTYRQVPEDPQAERRWDEVLRILLAAGRRRPRPPAADTDGA